MIQSGVLPRILAIALIVNCIALVAVSLTTLLLPSYVDEVGRFALIPQLGELWVMGWLLLKGARIQRV